MKAGRELDALVAEKVFGWRWHRGHTLLTPWNGIGVFIAKDQPPTYSENLPNYSTDIAAAWEVVEKTKLLAGWKLTYSIVNECWQIGAEDADGHFDVEASGDTAPHAICLAALKAVGVEL